MRVPQEGDPIFIHDGRLYVACEDGLLDVFVIEARGSTINLIEDGSYQDGKGAPSEIKRAGIQAGVNPMFFGVKQVIPRYAPRYIIAG